VATPRGIVLFLRAQPVSLRDYGRGFADLRDRTRSEHAAALELKNDNDQLMRIFFNVQRSTYVVFKCDVAKKQLNVEKVVLNGKQLFEAP
jgi:hypothetical protein